MTNAIDQATYENLRYRIDRHTQWLRSTGKNSYHPDEVPAHLKPLVTNEERGAVEVYEFLNDVPEKYFLYIREKDKTAVTWNGEKLGDVTFGYSYSCPGFWGRPSKRQPVTIRAINGRTYHGTYFKSSGDYARVKLSKA